MNSSHESDTIDLLPKDPLPDVKRNHGEQRGPSDIQKLSNCGNKRESKKDGGRRWSMHRQKGQPKIAITVRSVGNRRAECRPDHFNNGGAKKDNHGRRKSRAVLDSWDFDDQGRTGEFGSISQS